MIFIAILGKERFFSFSKFLDYGVEKFINGNIYDVLIIFHLGNLD